MSLQNRVPIEYDTFDIVIDSQPPYGFRLVQKLMDNSLVISKLRQGGKAFECGLRENDILTAVNSRSCSGFNCTQALNLIDSASQPLVLTVKRKKGTHPVPTNQQIIKRSTNFLPKKSDIAAQRQRTNNYILSDFSPTVEEQKAKTPIETEKEIVTQQPVKSSIDLTFVNPTPCIKPPEPKKVYVGSVRSNVPESDDKKQAVKFGEKTSIKIDPFSSTENHFDTTKKTFTDSTFYNDPNNRYPTIEEQVQLARKVALSVLAPINANSKGHKMFIKAKERASKFTTGNDEGDEENTEEPIHSNLEDINKKIVFVPKLPTESTTERLNAMSKEEIELMMLQQRKTTHTNVSPQICFSLADDLKNMKGKGGKLFAKRQAKSGAWTVGGEKEEIENIEEPIDDNNNNDILKEKQQKNIMDKINFKHQSNKRFTEDDKTNLGYGSVNKENDNQIPVNRLNFLIKKTQQSFKTPWDAAAEKSNAEVIFDTSKNVVGQYTTSRPVSLDSSKFQPEVKSNNTFEDVAMSDV